MTVHAEHVARGGGENGVEVSPQVPASGTTCATRAETERVMIDLEDTEWVCKCGHAILRHRMLVSAPPAPRFVTFCDGPACDCGAYRGVRRSELGRQPTTGRPSPPNAPPREGEGDR